MFRDAFGARGVGVCKGASMVSAMPVVKSALSKSYPEAVADEVSFHLTDWGHEAAILVAIHLFPERFTAQELQCAVEMIASHAPYHVAGMAEWLDCSVADCLPDFKRDKLRSEREKTTRKKSKLRTA